MTQNSNPAEVRQYAFVMGVFGVLFAISGAIFFLFPGFVFRLVNLGAVQYGLFDPMPDSTEDFWLVLSTSMMLMLTLLCFAAAKSPEVKAFAYIVMASKICSSGLYLLLFLFSARYCAYLAGFITDFPLFVLVGILSRRAFAALARMDEPV